MIHFQKVLRKVLDFLLPGSNRNMQTSNVLHNYGVSNSASVVDVLVFWLATSRKMTPVQCLINKGIALSQVVGCNAKHA